MKWNNHKIIASILFLLISVVSVAQVLPPPPPDAARPPFPPGLPIDGGLFIAMALGLFYGVYKIIKTK